KEWKDIKVKLATTSIQGKVILDVGGDKFSTSVETLTREKNTFFTALFSKQWQLERDPDDESIFIDRDGKLFNYILAYLRTNKLSSDILNNDSLRELLLTEAEYFHLHASRDGFDANAFHSRCNNKGPTMTIIQSNNNYLFGDYTAIPWTSDNSYKNDITAFLFTLTNPHKDSTV
ncbi:unnamed protein product, partial [Rotaria sp. Silwood1]